MREITLGEHPHFRVPTQDDRGTPVGIDVRAVVATGITPLINTGIAGRVPGTGQVGAGDGPRAPRAASPLRSRRSPAPRRGMRLPRDPRLLVVALGGRALQAPGRSTGRPAGRGVGCRRSS